DELDRLVAGALPERARIVGEGADARDPRELRLNFAYDLHLGPIAPFPWRELGERDQLGDRARADDHESVPYLGNPVQQRLELLGIAAREIDGGAFGRVAGGEQHAAILDRRKLRFQVIEQNIAAAGDGDRDPDDHGADAKRQIERLAVAPVER